MKALFILLITSLTIGFSCDDEGGDKPDVDTADTESFGDHNLKGDASIEDASIADASLMDTDTQPREKAYGTSCESHGDCPGGYCITTELPGFVGGYCTKLFCDALSRDSCGPNGVCVYLGDPMMPNLCVQTCEADSECRTEYTCVGICVPEEMRAEIQPGDKLDPDDKMISDALGMLDRGRIRKRLEVLSGETPWNSPNGPVTIKSRSIEHPDHAVAIEYLSSLLTEMGLKPKRLPALEYNGYESTNIEARIEGTDPSLEPVYLTAHYDSTGSYSKGWVASETPAPGAIDNGTGTAVLLDLAQVFQELIRTYPVPRSVVFMFFDGEETNKVGSEGHVSDLKDSGENILCALNLDQIGWTLYSIPGRFWYVHQPQYEDIAEFDLEAIADFVPEATVIPTQSPEWTSDDLDSGSYWKYGYCATSIALFPNHPTYHTVDDTIDVCDWEMLMTVARSAAAISVARAYLWTQ